MNKMGRKIIKEWVKVAYPDETNIDDQAEIIFGSKKQLCNSDVVYSLSTALFDVRDLEYNNVDIEEWLSSTKKYFGEDIYIKMLEGYICGDHDT